MKILVVEDHKDIAESIGDFLTMNDCIVDYAADGPSALNLAIDNDYDIYLLDIQIPGIDGLSLCRRLREEHNDATPVLFLTARDTLEDKINGFESGGDDYLVKPFQLGELLVRLKAIYKRSQPQNENILQIDDLCINTLTHEVARNNTTITLTPVGYKILVTLAQSSPHIVSREKLELTVWKDMLPDSDALRSHLYSLRQKIDKPFTYPLIHTIPKQGFRLYKP